MANVMISSTVSAENTLLFLQYCTVYCMFLDIPDTRKTGFSVRMFGRLVYNIFILNKCIVMYRKLHSGCFFPTHWCIHLPVFISCTVHLFFLPRRKLLLKSCFTIQAVRYKNICYDLWQKCFSNFLSFL